MTLYNLKMYLKKVFLPSLISAVSSRRCTYRAMLAPELQAVLGR